MQEELQNHFTDSIFYEIELTAKYCKMMGAQVFENFNVGVTIEEFSILDTILCNPGICQRDLAKLVLRDRANIGKLLEGLEKKGYLERKLAIKNNRPVKIANLTDTGVARTLEITERIKPHTEMIKERIQNSDLGTLKSTLAEFRKILNETLDIRI